MHDKSKDTKSFRELRKYLLNGYFFDSIAKSRIQNLIKSLWWGFFAKTVNDFQLLTLFFFFFEKSPTINVRLCCLQRKKKQFLYYFIYFYIILCDFINCPAFVDIKLCIKQLKWSKYKQIEAFIFYALFLMFASHFFAG